MTIHVANTVAEFLKEIKNGFNGVQWVELYNETQTGPHEGEQTQEEFEEWISGYAIFVAHADLYGDDLSYDDDNEYVETEFYWGKFENDFTKELQKRLGDDVKIEFRSGCNEWECQRITGYSASESNEVPVELIYGCTKSQITNACTDLQIKIDTGSWSNPHSIPNSITEIAALKGMVLPEELETLKHFLRDCAVKILSNI